MKKQVNSRLNISIHAPRGGSDLADYMGLPVGVISIHAPRGGSDQACGQFLCTGGISIHAPRGGSDPLLPCWLASSSDFNPRSPWGERHDFFLEMIKKARFQSTLPVGGATTIREQFKLVLYISIHAPRGGSDKARVWADRMLLISIHAPRGGSDSLSPTLTFRILYFNPRSPWGERQIIGINLPWSPVFQSTLPVGGATRYR